MASCSSETRDGMIHQTLAMEALVKELQNEMMIIMLDSVQRAAGLCADICVERIAIQYDTEWGGKDIKDKEPTKCRVFDMSKDDESDVEAGGATSGGRPSIGSIENQFNIQLESLHGTGPTGATEPAEEPGAEPAEEPESSVVANQSKPSEPFGTPSDSPLDRKLPASAVEPLVKPEKFKSNEQADEKTSSSEILRQNLLAANAELPPDGNSSGDEASKSPLKSMSMGRKSEVLSSASVALATGTAASSTSAPDSAQPSQRLSVAPPRLSIGEQMQQSLKRETLKCAELSAQIQQQAALNTSIAAAKSRASKRLSVTVVQPMVQPIALPNPNLQPPPDEDEQSESSESSEESEPSASAESPSASFPRSDMRGSALRIFNDSDNESNDEVESSAQLPNYTRRDVSRPATLVRPFVQADTEDPSLHPGPKFTMTSSDHWSIRTMHVKYMVGDDVQEWSEWGYELECTLPKLATDVEVSFTTMGLGGTDVFAVDRDSRALPWVVGAEGNYELERFFYAAPAADFKAKFLMRGTANACYVEKEVSDGKEDRFSTSPRDQNA